MLSSSLRPAGRRLASEPPCSPSLCTRPDWRSLLRPLLRSAQQTLLMAYRLSDLRARTSRHAWGPAIYLPTPYLRQIYRLLAGQIDDLLAVMCEDLEREPRGLRPVSCAL